MMNVNIIQRPLLLWILPPDSNVESSNMASLESGCGLPLFRHRRIPKCSRALKRLQKACFTYIRTAHYMQRLPQKSAARCLKPLTVLRPEELRPCRFRRDTAARPPASAPRSRSTNRSRSECLPREQTRTRAKRVRHTQRETAPSKTSDLRSKPFGSASD